MLSTEELLKPRYIVLSEFPMSLYNEGDIINGERAIIQYGTDETENDYYDISGYPKLFRKLLWFEKRAVEDLPEYVRINYPGSGIDGIHKVKSYSRINEGYIEFEFGQSPYRLNKFEPATLEQYTTYINQLNASE